MPSSTKSSRMCPQMHSRRVDSEYRDKTVCVTGATGGIGARLVEKLTLEHGARVRVLVRNLTRAPRVARLPVDLVCGDVNNAEETARAIQGCDVVMHCAYGGGGGDVEAHRRTNVGGTENVLAGCRRQGARLVHVSTCRVYGMQAPDGDLDETSPYRASGVAYADSKLDAEKMVFDWHRRYGMPVAVIQPTTVFGPFVQVWTMAYMKMLSRFRPILVDHGAGVCNAVYVDDVVDAMLLAGVREEAVGENFLISANEPISWAQFHDAFAALLGAPPGVPMSRHDALAYYNSAESGEKPQSLLRELPAIWHEEVGFRKRVSATLEYRTLRNVKRRLVPKRRAAFKPARGSVKPRPESTEAQPLPVRPLTPAEVDFFAGRTRFRIDKAKRLLGYEPQFEFERGMEMVAAWARWADLAPAAQAKTLKDLSQAG